MNCANCEHPRSMHGASSGICLIEQCGCDEFSRNRRRRSSADPDEFGPFAKCTHCGNVPIGEAFACELGDCDITDWRVPAAAPKKATPLRLELDAWTLANVRRNESLTLGDRALAYSLNFPECPNSVWVAGDRAQWLYGVWQLGAYYKNATRYYGAFPHSFIERVLALYPEIDPVDILHVFSGSLPAGAYTRLDINPECGAELVGSVYDVAALTPKQFRLVIADPSYSKPDAAHYGTPSIDRGRATRALADVVAPGGHLAWLDTAWPMHRKALWSYYGAITVIRSTNHRVWTLTLFERKAVSA